MRTDEQWVPGHLRDLNDSECRELLNENRVGRVAWCENGIPAMVPVNYRFDGEYVVFRTSAHSLLARHFREGPKAFQIDDHDDFQQSGWSVLVQGESEVLEWDELPDPENRPQPWIGGNRNVHIRISAEYISGRRVVPA